MNYLHEGLERLGFNKGEFHGIKTLALPELEKKLDLYIRLLLEYNAKFDLVNADTYEEIAVKHILDSLSGAEKIAGLCEEIIARQGADLETGVKGLELADIGSGAGLPGIPLAAAFPGLRFTLVERMTKRCGFLNVCIKELGLVNAAVDENQAERLEQRIFDLCVFRAFRPLDRKMLKVLRRILKEGGKLAAYKARSEKIHEEMEALEGAKPEYRIESLAVPFLTENELSGEERERNLVVIEK